MADEVKSFGDLKTTLIKAKPQTSAAQAAEPSVSQARRQGAGLMPPAAARTPWRAVWIKPGDRPHHHQQQGREGLFRASRAADDLAPALIAA